jgi:small subunit ribosomal protein S13
MARLAGVDLPVEKRADVGLTYVYGIGPSNVKKILETAKVDPAKRVRDLSEEELGRLQKAIEGLTLEGDLRREITQNIRRMEDIGTYKGLRHRKGLPARGQRTRSNARTKRGKRKTVGATSKETKAAAPAK